MPMYEFQCTDCNTEFEELMPLGSTQSPLCPSCGSEHTHKKMSTFAGRSTSGGGGSCGGRSGFT